MKAQHQDETEARDREEEGRQPRREEGDGPSHAVDVVLLGGAAGGVDEDDRARLDVGGVEGADEELVVRAVDGVTALERHHILHRRSSSEDNRSAGEDAAREWAVGQ